MMLACTLYSCLPEALNLMFKDRRITSFGDIHNIREAAALGLLDSSSSLARVGAHGGQAHETIIECADARSSSGPQSPTVQGHPPHHTFTSTPHSPFIAALPCAFHVTHLPVHHLHPSSHLSRAPGKSMQETLARRWALGRRVAALARFLMDHCHKCVHASVLAIWPTKPGLACTTVVLQLPQKAATDKKRANCCRQLSAAVSCCPVAATKSLLPIESKNDDDCCLSAQGLHGRGCALFASAKSMPCFELDDEGYDFCVSAKNVLFDPLAAVDAVRVCKEYACTSNPADATP
eukprot:1147379-Pelagomonas_calceolata.AAC.1